MQAYISYLIVLVVVLVAVQWIFDNFLIVLITVIVGAIVVAIAKYLGLW